MENVKVKKQRKGASVDCDFCGIKFYLIQSRINRSKKHFCNKKCANAFQVGKNTKTPTIECVNCLTMFHRKEYHKNKVKGLLCCSRKCRAEYLKSAYVGDRNPRYKKMDDLSRWFVFKTKNIKNSAKTRNLDFDLDAHYLMDMYKKQNGLCFYTGIPMQMAITENWGELKCAAPDILSVDRVDSSIGYLKGNVVLCCTAINKMKSNYSQVFLYNILGAIATKHSGSCHVKVKKIHENGVNPIKFGLGDVGYDLCAAWIKDEGKYLTVGTGIAIQPNIGWYFDLVARSSLHKRGLMLFNSVGIIDNSYQGEIICKLLKIDGMDHNINIGDRIVQIIPRKYAHLDIEEVTDFEYSSERGSNGYGSSGV